MGGIIGIIIILFFAICTLMIFIITTGFRLLPINRKFIKYLHKKKPKRFKELFGNSKLVSVGSFTGMIPEKLLSTPLITSSGLKYLYNNQDTNDSVIKKYKKKITLGIETLVMYFVLIFLIFVIMMALGWVGGYWVA